MQTMSLWGLAMGVSAKGLSSLTRQEREQLEDGLASLGRTLEEFKEDFTAEFNEAVVAGDQQQSSPRMRTEPSRPPRPSMQELHPELYQGDYAQFLNNYDFRYIRTHEIITPHCRTRGGISNGLPPKRLWHNITSSLRVADEIRHRLGTPLSYITSAYRTPSYNRKCGGASRSFHTRNNALDLVYESGSDAARDVALQLRKEGFFRGGIGHYAGFIHIDTRGYNATWEG
jgi:hypothetical protein